MNRMAVSQFGDNERTTAIFAAVLAVVITLAAHVTGTLLRREGPLVRWMTWMFSLIILITIAALAWMRRDMTMQLADYVHVSNANVLFIFCLTIQLLTVLLAAHVGYSLSDPLQKDFDKKISALKRARRIEAVARRKLINALEGQNDAKDGYRNLDFSYLDRSARVRAAIQERRKIYERSNRAARSDLEDGQLPTSFQTPLRLIEPQALQDAIHRTGHQGCYVA